MVKNGHKIKLNIFFHICILTCLSTIAIGQDNYVDSLKRLIDVEQSDSIRMRILTRIGHYYQDNNDDRAITYYQLALDKAEKMDQKIFAGNNYYSMAYSFLIKGDYDKSLENYLQCARIYESIRDSFRLANALMSIANVYSENKDLDKTDEYHEKAQNLVMHLKDSFLLCDLINSRGILYDQKQEYGQALFYFQNAYSIATALNSDDLIANTLSNTGLTYKHQNESSRALSSFEQVLKIFKRSDTAPYLYAMVYNNLASTHAQMNDYNLAEMAFETSISYAQEAGAVSIVMEGYRNLSDMYEAAGNFALQTDFLKKYYRLKDSLFTLESKNQMVRLEADYQIEQKNSELLLKERELTKQKNQRNLLVMVVLFALLLLIVVSYFYRRIKKTNRILGEKNGQINRQKSDLENTLTELKTTQSQLIQTEKMASLGELTAGIAHEIQNPLNFVNNFSEINVELIQELKEEIDNENFTEVWAIADDLIQNEQKIIHHGKRADAIVKGMLLHSRSDRGEKELTDLNTLAEEYLRLSYHGIKAKEPLFNATYDTDFDQIIPEILVVPQDIGRVLLNLINNAFYAVNEKAKNTDAYYQPKVTVSTELKEDQVVLTVKDNADGIPKEVISKIFQPFFTSKPTGSGTGLGLSLSYDIVKAHGGKIEVESKEGVGTTLLVYLPTAQ